MIKSLEETRNRNNTPQSNHGWGGTIKRRPDDEVFAFIKCMYPLMDHEHDDTIRN